jgi:hypothetical protein
VREADSSNAEKNVAHTKATTDFRPAAVSHRKAGLLFFSTDQGGGKRRVNDRDKSSNGIEPGHGIAAMVGETPYQLLDQRPKSLVEAIRHQTAELIKATRVTCPRRLSSD